MVFSNSSSNNYDSYTVGKVNIFKIGSPAHANNTRDGKSSVLDTFSFFFKQMFMSTFLENNTRLTH